MGSTTASWSMARRRVHCLLPQDRIVIGDHTLLIWNHLVAAK